MSGGSSLIRLVLILQVVIFTAANASVTDPFKYSISNKWNGIAIPSSRAGEILLYTPKPAWGSRSSSLSLISMVRSQTVHALSGTDIRAVQIWRNRVVVVVAQENGVEIVVLSDSLKPIASTYVQTGGSLRRDVPISVMASNGSRHAFIRISDKVLAIRPGDSYLQPIMIEESVTGYVVPEQGDVEVVLVHDVGGVAYVSILDSTFQRRVAPAVPLSDRSHVQVVSGSIVVTTPIGNSDACQVSVIDSASLNTKFFNVQIPMHLVAMTAIDGTPVPFGVGLVNGRYEFGKIDPGSTSAGINNGTVLPNEFGQPLSIRIHDEVMFIVCSGGILTADLQGDVLSSDAFEVPVDKYDIELYQTTRGMLISSRRGSAILAKSGNSLWLFLRILDTAWKYIVPLLLVLVIGYLVVKLRRLRRVLDAMIDLPGTGLLMVMDASGRLFRTNEQTAKLLGISKNVPMQRLYRAYLRQRGVEGLLTFLEHSLSGLVAVSEKVQINDSDEVREYVFTAVPLAGLLGRLRGWVVTGVDITEALEQRRIVNWAQLAHDMQTNLSTIRLNAEQLPEDGDLIYRERKRRILFQVGTLIQRVRDLVSVGRSETVDRVFVHSAEMCTDIRHEFDPIMFPHVSFSMKLRGTMMNVDRLKISRAVRNAVENGIKALKARPGTIEIATWFDRSNVYIRVSDNGVGMDTMTLENMMKPHFTTAKDGSGTGIGTMIMQHVVHAHNGSLRVTSEPGVGTQVIFRIPHMIEAPRIRHVQYAVEEEVE